MLFEQFRQNIKEKANRKNIVFSKRFNRIPVTIYKNNGKFSVEVDGDHLDTYRTQKEAEKFAKEFVKELK